MVFTDQWINDFLLYSANREYSTVTKMDKVQYVRLAIFDEIRSNKYIIVTVKNNRKINCKFLRLIFCVFLHII